jgi:hypothetical protein
LHKRTPDQELAEKALILVHNNFRTFFIVCPFLNRP